MNIVSLFWSPVHVYVGHFGTTPADAPMREAGKLDLVAGRGIVGDRYFDRPLGHKGQVTFFAEEMWKKLGEELGRPEVGPGVFRRNILTRDTDLLALVDAEFEVQGVRFKGAEYCKPCSWMDQAFGPGAYQKLADAKGGGLRARILNDGFLVPT